MSRKAHKKGRGQHSPDCDDQKRRHGGSNPSHRVRDEAPQIKTIVRYCRQCRTIITIDPRTENVREVMASHRH